MLDDLINDIIDKTVEKAVICTLEKIKGEYSSNVKEVMNTKQLSEYLGVSLQWVYKNSKQIPHERRGKKIIFRKSKVDDWIQHKNEELNNDKPLNYNVVSKKKKIHKVV